MTQIELINNRLNNGTQLAYIGGTMKSSTREKVQRTIYYLNPNDAAWELILLDVISFSEAYIGICDAIAQFPNSDFDATWSDINKIHINKI